MSMSMFGEEGGKERKKEVEFDSCMIYVKRTWPNDSEEMQFARAEAVYAMSKIFFDQILPSVLDKQLAFSSN